MKQTTAKRLFSRFSAFVLTLILVISLLPVAAYAADGVGSATVTNGEIQNSNWQLNSGGTITAPTYFANRTWGTPLLSLSAVSDKTELAVGESANISLAASLESTPKTMTATDDDFTVTFKARTRSGYYHDVTIHSVTYNFTNTVTSEQVSQNVSYNVEMKKLGGEKTLSHTFNVLALGLTTGTYKISLFIDAEDKDITQSNFGSIVIPDPAITEVNKPNFASLDYTIAPVDGYSISLADASVDPAERTAVITRTANADSSDSFTTAVAGVNTNDSASYGGETVFSLSGIRQNIYVFTADSNKITEAIPDNQAYQTVLTGGSVSIPAVTAAEGWIFTGWAPAIATETLAADGSDYSYAAQFAVDSNLNGVADDLETKYSVSIGVLTGGTVAAEPSESIEGATVNLTITPDDGMQLKNGTLKYNDGTGDYAITGTSFTMPEANVTVSAEFEEVPPEYYTVAIGALTGGSITADAASAEAGTTVNLTVTPDEGMQLKGDSLKYSDGTNEYTITGTSFVMPAANITVTAEFEEIVYEVTNLTMQPGTDETAMNFCWYSKVSTTSCIIEIAEASEMTDGEFPEMARSFTGIVKAASASSNSNEVNITGLKDSTEYVYRLSDGASYSPVYSFDTENSGSYTALLVGDPQIGASGNAANDSVNWENTVTAALSRTADTSFILSAGDQVETKTSEGQYVGFLGADELTSIPVVPTIGNHDNGALYSYHYNSPNESSTYGSTSAGGDYWFTYGNTLYMVLNSNNQSATTHEAFIAEVMSINPDAEWTVVMFHHSIYSSASHSDDSDILSRRSTLYPIFDEFDIDVVLMGHDHCYTRSYQMLGGEAQTDVTYDSEGRAVNPEGTLYITANSASGSKYYDFENNDTAYTAVRWQGYSPSYSVVEVTGNTFTINTYKVSDGSLIDTYSILKAEPASYSIAISPLTGGSITVDAASAEEGATINLTVTPDEGMQLVAGSLKYSDGTNEYAVTGTSFLMPAANVIVTAQFEEIPEETYSISIGTLTGGSVIADLVSAEEGATINLTVTPDEGMQLVAGSLKYSDGTNEYAVTGTSFLMPAANVTVTAQFEEIPAETKNVLEIENAAGNQGSDITVKVTAKNTEDLAGIKTVITYDADKLELKGIEVSSALGASAVNDETAGRIVISAVNSSGITTPELEIAELTFTSKAGYAGTTEVSFESVEACNSSTGSLDFAKTNGSITVSGVSGSTSHSISIGTLAGGSITADKVEAEAGETVTLTITPDEGMRLVAGSLKYTDGTTEYAITGTSFEMPDAAVTITAEFEEIPVETYSISLGTLTGGVITTDKAEAEAGETVTLTITPNEGMRLKAGTLKYSDGTTEYAIAGTSFTMPAADVTVTAEFELIPEEPGTLPTATDVTFTGETVVGETLEAQYTYHDESETPESGTAFRWLAAAHGTGNYIAIEGASGRTFTVTAEYAGMDIRVEVTPVNENGAGTAVTGDNGNNQVVLLGDRNNDGKVNFVDAMLLMQTVTGDGGVAALDAKTRAIVDVNNDGDVNILDVIKILRADVGLDGLN